MHTSHRGFAALALLLAGNASAGAQEAGDPLRFVPASADFVIKLNEPRRAAEAIYRHEAVQEFLKIEGVRKVFDTTNYRRFLQLLSYYEKQLGVAGNDLIDRLTGGGAVFAVKFQDPNAALIVVQGKDEGLMQQFLKLTVAIAEQELARQESKEKLQPAQFAGVDGFRIGKGCVAVVGSTLLFSSDPAAMEAAMKAAVSKSGSIVEQPRFKEAQPLVSKNPLAWLWLDMDGARKVQNFKAGLDSLGMDPNGLVLFGGLVDMLLRTPSFVVNLERENKDFALQLTMPRGREGMNAKASLYVPSDDKGSLPLLQPPGVLASFSYFFDLKGFWDNRDKLLTKPQLKGIEEFDANSGRFLGGTKLSTLFKQVGPHQRVVLAQPSKSPYAIKPRQYYPAFAVVLEMRDPAFAKSMNTVLRAAGILGAFTYNLKLVEENRGPHTLVTYYFPEDKKVPGDTAEARFNFSPCFVTVGDQLVMSSTAELGRDLVDLLAKEQAGTLSPASTRILLSARGGAQALRDNRDQLLAQTILAQAMPPAAARKEVDTFLNLLERLGDLRFEVRYGQNDFRYGIRWAYGSTAP